jgi:heavy metal sensor kinase
MKNAKWKMVRSDSMRLRLTLWYTGVLALVLIFFAIGTYAYLARAARERDDQSLRDTANSLISDFETEMNDEHAQPQGAAIEVTDTFQFKDRQAIFFDANGQTVAASAPPAESGSVSGWPSSATLSQNASKPAGPGGAYVTIPGEQQDLRVFAAAVPESSYTLVIAHSLREQSRELAQARRAFVIAVPLTILIASLGGYFLARKSLAPVIAMGDQAARIGASNLNERLAMPGAHNELHRLALLFNDLLSRLDRSFQQQRQFMADASHELRTPVAIVCGESEVALSQDRQEADYRESLAVIQDEGRRLTRIVEDLFMLARADAGQYPVEISHMYLDETVGECVRSIDSLAKNRNIELSYQTSEHELSFQGDEALIRRMALNILDNAIKYTSMGGRVRVDLQRNGKECCLTIANTGVEIPADLQPRIFERFFRADKARSRYGNTKGSGAGLGLSIAQWIAQMHDGRIELDHSDQNGTSFTIHLPIIAQDSN